MHMAERTEVDRTGTGRCFCGAIAAEMTGEPFWICFDHDEDCRRAIGSPLAVWIGYRPGQVLFTGEPARFSRTPGVVRTFCGRCGTSIGYADEGLADELYIAIGFMDRPERFPPAAHAGWKERLPWLHFADRRRRIDGCSRPRDPALGDPGERR
jgi:hypothetical protein